jgi:hypothetical protein
MIRMKGETVVVDMKSHVLCMVLTFPSMGVWQGVTMESLKFHPGLPCPTLLRPVDGPHLKRPYSHFRRPAALLSSTLLDTVRLWTFPSSYPGAVPLPPRPPAHLTPPPPTPCPPLSCARRRSSPTQSSFTSSPLTAFPMSGDRSSNSFRYGERSGNWGKYLWSMHYWIWIEY